jgi:hypothetical protein
MQIESFNNELYTSTIQFVDIFNHIAFTGRNSKTTKVGVVLGNRSRIFKDLENPNKAPIVYPLIAVQRTALSRDTTRVNDINENMKAMTGSIDYDNMQGNPVNITFQVTIFSKRQSEIERIIGNFIPFFQPDVYVRVPHPKLADKKMNLQVVWDGEVDEEWPFELGPEQPDTNIATLTFILKTSLFAGTSEYNGIGNPIESIHFTLTESLSGESIYPNNYVGGFYEVPFTVDLCDYYDDVRDGTIPDPAVDEFIVTE